MLLYALYSLFALNKLSNDKQSDEIENISFTYQKVFLRFIEGYIFYNYVEALAFTKLTTPTKYICSINFISFSFSNSNYIYLTHVNL